MVQLQIMSKIMFSKFIRRLDNYQNRNPIEYQNLNVTKICTENMKSIQMIFNDQYEITISITSYDYLSILIECLKTHRLNLFYLVPPMTINQEVVRFNCSTCQIQMNTPLVIILNRIFKLKFYDTSIYHFETRNDVLSQT